MQFLIRRWIRINKQTRRREFREILIRTRRLTIGRGVDQHLQIADSKVEPRHAEITIRKGRLVIMAVTPAGFLVNRRPRRIAVLSAGDIVQIGSAVITVDILQRGSPVVLGFGPAGEQEAADLGTLHVTSLNRTKLSKPFWSWTLGLSALLLFFLIPVSGVVYSSLREPLRDLPLAPSDNLWLSGPLHAKHQFIGEDCNVCHVKPFEMVRNDRCIDCHAGMQHHVDVNSSDVELFDQKRCAACHREHNEPSTLVKQDERLCTDCHARMSRLKDRSELVDVSDFGKDHPELGLALLEPSTDLNETIWKLVRYPRTDGKPIRERSNLKFPHATHMNPKGIRSPEGDQVLTCQDCHRPDTSGRHMVPIRMEAQCSRCHSLLFDPNDANTKVPHGDMKQLNTALREYYSRQFLEGALDDDDRPVLGMSRGGRLARRPGGTRRSISAQEQRRATEWIEQKTMATMTELLEKRVCVNCHEITKDPLKKGPEQWMVWPVRLTPQFMPRARFDHASHSTSACTDCHKNAQQSKQSSDVLMPKIAVCRDCHGGSKDKRKLQSDCLMCHQFHLPGSGLFDESSRGRILGPPALITGR